MSYFQTCFIVSGGQLVQHFSVHIQDLLLQDGRIGQAAPLPLVIFLFVLFSVAPLFPLVGEQLLAQSLGQVRLGEVSGSLVTQGKRKTGVRQPQVKACLLERPPERSQRY